MDKHTTEKKHNTLAHGVELIKIKAVDFRIEAESTEAGIVVTNYWNTRTLVRIKLDAFLTDHKLWRKNLHGHAILILK